MSETMREEPLRELLSPEGQELLASLGTLRDSDDIVALVSRLRAAGHPADRVAAVVDQTRLRDRARSRFGDAASRMLFTRAGLEQATRARVAELHAERYVRAGLRSVADLGCGIGADALAFAEAGLEVLAVERDAPTAALAAWNLAPFESARVIVGDATEVDLGSVASMWADPARRSGTTRHADPADWSPPLTWVFERMRERPAGVKLGPGLDHALIPDGVEAQWVSDGREVVELALWSGSLARPGIARAALVLTATGAAELTGPGPAEDAEVRALGEYLVEPDGTVIRAQLIGELARRLDGGMIDPTIAWITTDRDPADVAEAAGLGAAFRVIERYPLDAKTLKRELGPRYRSLEIKKRGVDIDPATFRSRLSLKGSESGVLILTRVAGARTALLAERVAERGSPG